jgi:hypothetical protein
MEWREAGGLRWLEASLPGATAAFTTRTFGSAKESLNPLSALGIDPDRIVSARQVHGAELAFHGDGEAPAEADGHVLHTPGLAGLVYVADCLPMALAGPGGAAILHCGWRGLAAGIVSRGAAAVGATHAAIGPGIGPCCYEVGEEVLAALSPAADGPKTSPSVPKSSRRPRGRAVAVDLVGVATRQLRGAGVEEIESAGLCTSCEPELFFSHRRDAGRTGRQAGLVWRDGEGS